MANKVNKRFLKDSHFITDLKLCSVRLIDNCNFPWIILIPNKKNITDITELNLKDPGRIRQMMHNLIRNSIEAIDTKENGFINITARHAEIKKIAMIEITVEDNGGGFKAESLGQVFDPYVTSKPKGTGLGLAIVKKLVEEHMGSIEATNTENHGALISILLPRYEGTREAIISN